jgi:hypothetical protein
MSAHVNKLNLELSDCCRALNFLKVFLNAKFLLLDSLTCEAQVRKIHRNVIFRKPNLTELSFITEFPH